MTSREMPRIVALASARLTACQTWKKIKSLDVKSKSQAPFKGAKMQLGSLVFALQPKSSVRGAKRSAQISNFSLTGNHITCLCNHGQVLMSILTAELTLQLLPSLSLLSLAD